MPEVSGVGGLRAVDPAAKGFSAERLARLSMFLDEQYVRPGLIPGVQLLIARDGEVVHFSSHGIARADGKPVDERTIFRIASMTKPITSVAFMTLVEEGRVTLDQEVGDVLPEWTKLAVFESGGGAAPFRCRAPARPLQMIDLLRHTSGLTYGFLEQTNVDAAYREAGIDPAQDHHDLESMIAALAEIPLEFSPGEAWNYSVSTDVIGAIIQRLSGMKLDEFLEQRILRPLGMEDTGFHVRADQADRLSDAWALYPSDGTALWEEAVRSPLLKAPRLLSGGGGLVSTSADYHRFCRMLLNGGALDGARILAPKTIELMTMNHLPGGADLSSTSRSLFSEAANAGQGFGLGFAVVQDVARTMLPGSRGEYHWGGLYSTAFFIDPAERIHVILMAQLLPSSAYPIRRQLRALVYAALEG